MDQKKKKGIGATISSFFTWLANDIKEIGVTFKEGDWKTKVSFIIMGFAELLRGQILRGVAFLLLEAGFIAYMVGFGAKYLAKLSTLGTIETGKQMVTTASGAQMEVTLTGDNSFLILLFSVLSLFAVAAFIFVWRLNVRDNFKCNRMIAEGRALPTIKQDLYSLIDENFDKTLLALPVIGVFVFIVLPIVFMICIAFTNYDYNHQSPAHLFTWVGIENFKELFSTGSSGYGGTFGIVLAWTLVWAFFATFLNYFLGMAIAILINKKGIKFKKLWRTILVMTIAVPQFVSLLYVGKMFAVDGLINSYLMKWGLIKQALPFWTDPNWARPTIIFINLWIGVPYVMLITTGLLMNIPEDLYESARIDGANAFQMFRKITLPYMLFVTGPYLLTSYTGNLNNFNVIYLLTQGKPQSMSMSGAAGYTDLLVTWLYKMTVNDTNYKIAAVIGIMVFLVTAVISLVVYNILPSVKDEEGFQ